MVIEAEFKVTETKDSHHEEDSEEEKMVTPSSSTAAHSASLNGFENKNSDDGETARL